LFNRQQKQKLQKSFGRATIPTKRAILFAGTRPFIGILSGYTRYFGSLLLSLTQKQEPKFSSEKVQKNQLKHQKNKVNCLELKPYFFILLK
jgi:hypothetical protein